MGKQQSFILYDAWGHMVQSLPDETAGKLIKALFTYRQTGTASVDDPTLSGILSFMTDQMRKDAEAYDRKCAINSENKRKYWEEIKRTNTNVYERIRTNTDNDNDNDNDLKKKNIKKKKAIVLTCEPRNYDFDELERKVNGL